jgi:hypothetical protein
MYALQNYPFLERQEKSLKIPKDIHSPSKNRQHNGQRKRYKKTNNNLQNTRQKTKGRATRTPLKRGVKSGAPER